MWVEFCAFTRKSNNVEPWRRVVNSCSGKMIPSISSHANKKARYRVYRLDDRFASSWIIWVPAKLSVLTCIRILASIVLWIIKIELSSGYFHLGTSGGLHWSKNWFLARRSEKRLTKVRARTWKSRNHQSKWFIKNTPRPTTSSSHYKSAIFTKHSGIPQGCPPPYLSHLPSFKFISSRPVIGTINPPLRHRTLGFFRVSTTERTRGRDQQKNSAIIYCTTFISETIILLTQLSALFFQNCMNNVEISCCDFKVSKQTLESTSLHNKLRNNLGWGFEWSWLGWARPAADQPIVKLTKLVHSVSWLCLTFPELETLLQRANHHFNVLFRLFTPSERSQSINTRKKLWIA